MAQSNMGQIVEFSADSRTHQPGQDDADPEIAEGGRALLVDLVGAH
jgi:hypothetical protein